MKYIYVTMVQLPTLANKCASKLTGFPYIHASLSFDENLEKLYAFQIKNKDTPLVGGFVEELHSFYFHGQKNIFIKEMVFKIPVTDDEYEKIVNFVTQIKNDTEYIFNYVSALFMFTIGGIKAYKAYHCIEFVSNAISFVNRINLPKPAHKMRPQDLYRLLKPFLIEQKELCSNDFETDESIFFKDIKFHIKIKKSFYSIKEAICRAIFARTSKHFNHKNINYYDLDIIK